MLIKNNRIFFKIFLTMFSSFMFLMLIYSVYSISNQKSQILKSLNTQAYNMAKMLTYISTDAIILDDGSNLVEIFDKFLNQNEIVKEIIFTKNNSDSYIVRNDGWSFEEKFEKYKEFEEKDIMTDVIIDSDKSSFLLYTYPIIISSTKWGYFHMCLSLDEYNYNLNFRT